MIFVSPPTHWTVSVANIIQIMYSANRMGDFSVKNCIFFKKLKSDIHVNVIIPLLQFCKAPKLPV